MTSKDPLRTRTFPLKFSPIFITHFILLILLITIVVNCITQWISPRVEYVDNQKNNNQYYDTTATERGVPVPFHLPPLSETGISGLSRFFFNFACTIGSVSFVALGVLGLCGGMETISRGRSGALLVMHRIRCALWILVGVALWVIGTVPLRDLGTENDPLVTFWELNGLSSPFHLTSACIFFVASGIAMVLGFILAVKETRETRMSKGAKSLIVAWKGLTAVLAILCWPVLPLLDLLAVYGTCDLASSETLSSCWLVKLDQYALNALLQYGFVIFLCEHIASYVWDLKNGSLCVNPDVTLSLFREVNTADYVVNDEFKVNDDLDDLASADSF